MSPENEDNEMEFQYEDKWDDFDEFENYSCYHNYSKSDIFLQNED
jgi:hypothetical protein